MDDAGSHPSTNKCSSHFHQCLIYQYTSISADQYIISGLEAEKAGCPDAVSKQPHRPGSWKLILACQQLCWQVFIYQVAAFLWTWQHCSRCEGQPGSHILIKDRAAKNTTNPPPQARLPTGTPLTRWSREKPQSCNYHACTTGLLFCINVSWTASLLLKPLAAHNVPQCTWSLIAGQQLTPGVTCQQETAVCL